MIANTRIKDVSGHRFGKLVAVALLHANPTTWLCDCDCGNTKTATLNTLSAMSRKKQNLSCGCARNQNHVTHGLTKHPLYRIWHLMKSRCTNSKLKCFKDYGGRGIQLCAEWQNDFSAFFEWSMANGWARGLTIDRENNDGDYSPGNCRWVTRKVQQNNTRHNHWVEFEGKLYTIAQLAEKFNAPYKLISQRICAYGWSVERAIMEFAS